jgi:hypothetical protein
LVSGLNTLCKTLAVSRKGTKINTKDATFCSRLGLQRVSKELNVEVCALGGTKVDRASNWEHKKTAPITMIRAAYTHNLLSYSPNYKAGILSHYPKYAFKALL